MKVTIGSDPKQVLELLEKAETGLVSLRNGTKYILPEGTEVIISATSDYVFVSRTTALLIGRDSLESIELEFPGEESESPPSV